MIIDDKILLYDAIVGEGEFGCTASQFAEDLHGLRSRRQITIAINSPGGSVFAGIAIAEHIRSARKLGMKITAQVDGLCASIATLIAFNCTKVTMADGALLMIHLPFAPQAGGNAVELKKTIELLEKVTDEIIKVYSRRTGKSDSEIRSLLEAETWMDADEAMAGGWIDEISAAPVAVAARIDIDKCSAPQKYKDKARRLVDSKVHSVLRNVRRARESNDPETQQMCLDLACMYARDVTRTPNVRSIDMACVARALKTWQTDPLSLFQ